MQTTSVMESPAGSVLQKIGPEKPFRKSAFANSSAHRFRHAGRLASVPDDAE